MSSDTLFNSTGCFVQSPPFAPPHFNKLEAFFLYTVSSQCVETSLLATTLNTLFSERGTQFSTETEVVKATHGFKHSVTMRTKPINTEAIIFFVSVCCKETFNFTFWSCLLEIGHDYTFQAAGLVFSSCESTRLWIEIPTRLKTGRHGSTHRVGISLAGINPNNRFAYACGLSNKSLINNCFGCKNDRWTTNNIFSNFFPKGLLLLPWRDRILQQYTCVSNYWPSLVKYKQVSTYRYLCRGKKQFFCIAFKLGTTCFLLYQRKSLWRSSFVPTSTSVASNDKSQSQ